MPLFNSVGEELHFNIKKHCKILHMLKDMAIFNLAFATRVVGAGACLNHISDFSNYLYFLVQVRCVFFQQKSSKNIEYAKRYGIFNESFCDIFCRRWCLPELIYQF